MSLRGIRIVAVAINQKLYDRLLEAARAKQTINYGSLYDFLKLPPIHSRRIQILSQLLDEISTSEHEKGNPLLSVVVVRSDNGMPGKGFFDMAKRIRVQGAESDFDFFRSQLEAVYGKWRRPLKYWLETYWPYGREREFLGVWFHQKKVVKFDDVLPGDRVLFYETDSDPDGTDGAKALFACGEVTTKLRDVPEENRFKGGRIWTKIRLVQPLIWLEPTKGIHISGLRQLLGKKINGWVRQGKSLSETDYLFLEKALADRESAVNETTNPQSPRLSPPSFEPFRQNDPTTFQGRDAPSDLASRLAAGERAWNSHERIRGQLAKHFDERGAAAQSHPHVDLKVELDGTEWFFEVKSCHAANIYSQVRAGIAQLLEYKFRFGSAKTKLCLVVETFHASEAWDLLSFLDSLGILLVWPTRQGFRASELQAQHKRVLFG